MPFGDVVSMRWFVIVSWLLAVNFFRGPDENPLQHALPGQIRRRYGDFDCPSGIASSVTQALAGYADGVDLHSGAARLALPLAHSEVVPVLGKKNFAIAALPDDPLGGLPAYFVAGACASHGWLSGTTRLAAGACAPVTADGTAIAHSAF